MNPALSIRRGDSSDIERMAALLEESGLPTEDLRSVPRLDIWLLEGDTGNLVGTIALERYGSEGLLRSLAIAPDYRNRGLARRLVAKLEEDACDDGVELLVLLTQTAESFFQKLGYSNTDRSEISESVKQSAEFKSLCPASARCLSRKTR